MDTLLLVHKTHLDIGFTDMPAVVERQYLEQFIPAAIEQAASMNVEGQPPRFVWTTGSWIVWKALNAYKGDALSTLEDAIRRGWIAWHALPFTFHTELLSPALARLALKFAQDLDERFERTTIAAKMTDVPGHTAGLVPVLAEAGVRLLHVGVNPASRIPDVPGMFRWRCDGAEVTTIYAGTYGSVTPSPDGRVGLAFLHTNDNLGPPSEERIAEEESWLRARYDAADVRAASMDEFARAIESSIDALPVVDAEIGDTWIHGVGTDPAKLADYAAMRRAVDRCASKLLAEPLESIAAWLEPLLLVPEHTWSLDVKAWFGDHGNYRPSELAAIRRSRRVRMMDEARDVQRTYAADAEAAMAGELRSAAQDELQASRAVRVAPSLVGFAKGDVNVPLRAGRWLVRMEPATGCVSSVFDTTTQQDLCPDGGRLSWGIPRYDLLGYDVYRAFLDAYMGPPPRPWWAEDDFGKPGLHRLRPTTLNATLRGEGMRIARESDRVIVHSAMSFRGEGDALESAPVGIRSVWTFHRDEPVIEVAFGWDSKTPTRSPEAGFLGFRLPSGASDFRLRKLGQSFDPHRTIAGGGRHLHAIDGPVTCALSGGSTIAIESLDALLVTLGDARLLRDPDEPVDATPAVWFNLFNNAWNTNFPLWFGEPMGFRFRITLG